jgi:hypothetical protein
MPQSDHGTTGSSRRHRSRKSTRQHLQRRFIQRRLRKILFFVMLVAASLSVGYMVSRYEPGTHRSD